ncbi:MAG: phenylalanine--tRNA ligase subunit beta, partial [Candidatus Saccharimonadales bacterium]|nr:phenylalanine--tRNA ligase subunit beta [Candidatus Saccharimonadales bacterium]
ELIERITSRIGEVEQVEKIGTKYDGIVVGEVKEAKDHPDADKLSVYQVDIGNESIQVVAGDKTLQPGDLAAYIPPGTVVPDTINDDEPFKIEKRELRGIESNGMLASAKELGFSDDHQSVLVLDEKADPGTPFKELYLLDDVVLDIENKALTHRPDCFGVIGFAREVAAIEDVAFKTPEWFIDGTPPQGSGLDLDVTIKIPEDCPRFTAQAFSNVEIKPSPVKVQAMLSRLDVRPISNVVDLTNYLMIMTGQPFHAFDYDKVAALSDGGGVNIVVRFPKSGEKITLLDDREIEPHSRAAMVATKTDLLSVGGSIGGAETEVDENTKNIIMEDANWELYSIRTNSMKHGIFTEAVTRFARGQDPEMCLPIQARAAKLLAEWSGAKPASPLVDAYPNQPKPVGLSANSGKINALLGINLDIEEQARTLANAEFDVTVQNEDLDILVPSWRGDIHIEQDVVEEIGRLRGYDQIPVTLPFKTIKPVELSSVDQLKNDIRRILASAGANEQLSYNFISDKLAEASGYDLGNLYRLRNAISPELQYLRPGLLSSLINHAYPNHRLGYGQMALFELNLGHSKTHTAEDGLPYERQRLALLFSASEKTATKEYHGAPFYLAVKYLEQLAEGLKLPLRVESEKSPDHFEDLDKLLHNERNGIVLLGGQPVGLVGEFSDAVHRSFKLPLFAAGFEIDLELVQTISDQRYGYQPLSKFPGTSQDVTFKVPSDTSFNDVKTAMTKGLSQDNFILSIQPLDAYQNESDQKHKNLTYRVVLQHTEQTLKTAEVNQIIDQMVGQIESEFKAQRV